MREDKQRICNLLTKTLQSTRRYFDLIDLIYEQDEQTKDETVTAVFVWGKVSINVSMDSGAAMIRDIMRRLKDA
jgi:hypothetical protein